MSKPLLALNVLLAATAVLLATQLVQVLSAPRPLPPSSGPPAGQTVVPTKNEPAAQRPPLPAYGVVATRNLFNPNRSEVTAQAVAAPVPKPILHGVVIDGTTRLAYLEDPTTKRVFGYKTGDTVAGGQLEQIEDDRVVIGRPDGPLEVKLKDPSKPKPVVAAPAPPGRVIPRVGIPRAPSITPFPPGVTAPRRPSVPRPTPPVRGPLPRETENAEEPEQSQ